MRKYKFRGRVIDSDPRDAGKIVYGSLVICEGFWSFTYYICPFVGNRKYQVDPDSVAQLIDVDKKGNEVYEGDEIVSLFGSYCLAWFNHYAGIRDGVYTLSQT